MRVLNLSVGFLMSVVFLGSVGLAQSGPTIATENVQRALSDVFKTSVVISEDSQSLGEQAKSYWYSESHRSIRLSFVVNEALSSEVENGREYQLACALADQPAYETLAMSACEEVGGSKRLTHFVNRQKTSCAGECLVFRYSDLRKTE